MKRALVVLVVVAVLAAVSVAQAAIVGVQVSPPGTGGVLGISGVDTTIYKDFNPIVGLGPVDVSVTVDSAMPVYIHETPTSQGPGFIHNFSGQAWTDFHFEVISGAATFMAPPTDDVFTSNSWTSPTPTSIDLWGGTVPVGTDFHANIYLMASAPGTFVVREWATVPEPSTLLLLGVGAIALLGCAWRRRKA